MTEEQVIGTWYDGKPIYRKVIDCGNLPNASNKNIPVNISNLKNIVSLQGIASYGDISFPFNNVRPRETSNIATIGLYFYGGNITIETGNDRSAYTGYVTIEYTKTTDTANGISFTALSDYSAISNRTYQAEQGMTWQQFINSNYNTDGFSAKNSNVFFATGDGYYICSKNDLDTKVLLTDTIQNTTYYFVDRYAGGVPEPI